MGVIIDRVDYRYCFDQPCRAFYHDLSDFIFLMLSLFVGVVVADGVPQVVQDKAAELIPDRSPDSVSPTPVAGLYEVTFGTQVYLFEDGQHLLRVT